MTKQNNKPSQGQLAWKKQQQLADEDQKLKDARAVLIQTRLNISTRLMEAMLSSPWSFLTSMTSKATKATAGASALLSANNDAARQKPPVAKPIDSTGGS